MGHLARMQMFLIPRVNELNIFIICSDTLFVSPKNACRTEDEISSPDRSSRNGFHADRVGDQSEHALFFNFIIISSKVNIL